MLTNKQYQTTELNSFLNQRTGYFDSVQEFAESLKNMNILEQIEWIENGSYGAGACFALQRALRDLTPRCNKQVRIGNVVLHAFYGKPFGLWRRLPADVQDAMNQAVDTWLNQDHEFAQDLEI